ncbi:unnamed protein product [Oikopleura dioica]|nr:unnamed protein product [Oikopleura dioica]
MAPNASEDNKTPARPDANNFRIPRVRMTARRSVGGRAPRKTVARVDTVLIRRMIIEDREQQAREEQAQMDEDAENAAETVNTAETVTIRETANEAEACNATETKNEESKENKDGKK